jgi:hypothetical protein
VSPAGGGAHHPGRVIPPSRGRAQTVDQRIMTTAEELGGIRLIRADEQLSAETTGPSGSDYEL